MALRFGFGCCGWLVLVLIGFAFLLLRVDIRAGVCGVVSFVWLGFWLLFALLSWGFVVWFNGDCVCLFCVVFCLRLLTSDVVGLGCWWLLLGLVIGGVVILVSCCGWIVVWGGFMCLDVVGLVLGLYSWLFCVGLFEMLFVWGVRWLLLWIVCWWVLLAWVC